MRNRWLPLIAVILAATSLEAQTADTVWSELYLRDLAEARRVIAENHPGPVDRQNPAFARQLDSAYAAAVALAPRVRDYDGFAIALTMFGNRFQDAHLNVAGRRAAGALGDAGIYTRLGGGRLVVAGTAERYGGSVPRGSVLVGCDGVPALRLLEERVLSWRGRRGIVADRYTYAPMLLLDYGAPAPAAPRTCEFATGLDTIAVTLEWEQRPRAEVGAALAAINEFPDQRLSLRRSGRTLWVSLPTFSVRGDEQIALMQHVIDSVGAELRSGSATDLVVLDLRGNSGGSSSWGDRIAGHLFGEEWRQRARAWLGDGVYTEWRASTDNIAALERLAQQVEGQGRAADAASLRALRDSMVVAHEAGIDFVSPGSRRERTGVPRPEPARVPFRVVAVTSASCFSACLDFMDVLRLHPAVMHVGQPTGVDTDYMENWGQTLPSGAAGVSYPMKVYRNRRRANNEGYVPHVPRDDLHDSAALERWFLDRFAGT